MAPDGLTYVSSWVDEKLERCYQLMETQDRALLDQWMANWSDLTDFEVYPVITSKEAAERMMSISGCPIPSDAEETAVGGDELHCERSGWEFAFVRGAGRLTNDGRSYTDVIQPSRNATGH